MTMVNDTYTGLIGLPPGTMVYDTYKLQHVISYKYMFNRLFFFQQSLTGNSILLVNSSKS
jgi:hypothetical protein